MPAEVERARRLFTRAEYHCMGDAGILKPTERVELIRGEIIEMSPIGARHVAFVNNLNQLLVTRLEGRAIVSVQNPVALDDDTEPEPDLAILRRRRPAPYKESEPVTEDVLLLIETGDTSLTYDRGTKLRLYAEAGIPEYWVVDASAEVVEIHRGPAAEGYGETRRLTGGATVSPQAFPDIVLPLVEIFA
jgi:Uma2 family endonuclease